MANVLKNTISSPILMLAAIAAMAIYPAMALAGDLSEWVDQVMPVGLSVLGIAIGCPVLLLAGKIWGRAKPARLIEDLVRAVQSGRRTLTTDRTTFNKKLSVTMHPETIEAVKAVKKKLGLGSARRRDGRPKAG